MPCIQKRAHDPRFNVRAVQAAIGSLRDYVRAAVPADFEVGVLVGGNDVSVTWTLLGVDQYFANEVRAGTLAEVVEQLRVIDWGTERLNARIFGRVSA